MSVQRGDRVRAHDHPGGEGVVLSASGGYVYIRFDNDTIRAVRPDRVTPLELEEIEPA